MAHELQRGKVADAEKRAYVHMLLLFVTSKAYVDPLQLTHNLLEAISAISHSLCPSYAPTI